MTHRVALVTGAARGIGRGIAADLARDHEVALTWHMTDPGPLLAERPDLLAVRADLSNPDAGAPAAIIAAVIDRFGRLDVIVNNAGHVVETAHDAPDVDGLRTTFEVNLFAPMALLAAALPHLEPGASVVNISSVNARLPALAAAGYSASKAALETWTRAAAKALGPRGIRVNAVAPGAVERPEDPRPEDLLDAFLKDTALGRAGTPADIAAAVRFLAGGQSAFVTGEILTVSGGYRL